MGAAAFRSALRILLVAAAVLVGTAHADTVQYVYDELGRLVAEIDGAGQTTLYSYDAAGNLLSVSRDSSSQFRVIAFAPTRGKAGDIVTLFGSGFIANPAQNTVSFNGTPATVISATANQLVVTVPSGVATGPITVSNANGSAATAQPFTVVVPAVINAVAPSSVGRAATTRVDLSGSHLASARAVTFGQAGMVARIVPSPTDQLVTLDLSIASSVPVGMYGFSVVTDAGTTESGSVTVSVTTALLGDALTVTRPLSVYLRSAEPGAPPGNKMSVTLPLSVHLPAVIPGAPPGNAMSVTRPLSVSMP